MTSFILQLKGLGVDKVLRFSFVTAPLIGSMANGIQLLYAIKAIDDECRLTTEVGLKLVEFPLDPLVGKMLLSSEKFSCSEEALTIAAMLQLESIYHNPPYKKKESELARMKFAAKEGDHVTFINIYNTFIKKGRHIGWCKGHFLNHRALCQAEKIRKSLLQLLKRYNVKLISAQDDDVPIRKCIASAFFPRVARYHPSGEYRTLVTNKPLHIHPLSVLSCEYPPQWVIFNQVLSAQKDYMKDVTVIDPKWLIELAPHFYQFGTDREISENQSN